MEGKETVEGEYLGEVVAIDVDVVPRGSDHEEVLQVKHGLLVGVLIPSLVTKQQPQHPTII